MRENYTKQIKYHTADNGGGYGRAKLFTNCPICNCDAVFFQGYDFNEENIGLYIDDYMSYRFLEITSRLNK